MIIFISNFGNEIFKSYKNKGGLNIEHQKKLKAVFINAFNIDESNWDKCYIDFGINNDSIRPYVSDIKYWKKFTEVSSELTKGGTKALYTDLV